MFLALAWGLLQAASASRREPQPASIAVDSSSSLVSKASWHCPKSCKECCQAENSITWFGLARQDRTAFKCILDMQLANGFGKEQTFTLEGRQCSAPQARHSDTLQAKTHCLFNEDERDAHRELHPCHFAPEVQSYMHWSRGWCSYTSIGGYLNMGVVGAFVTKMYFKVEEGLTGGVCGMKGEEFDKLGLFLDLCRRVCNTSKPDESCFECKRRAKRDMCSFLRGELDQGRLDSFSMAVWAGAVGDLVNVTHLPKPASKPQLLRKFKIPGWQARTVAFQAPEEDYPIDLAMGGFMCMMEKLQEVPLEDNLVDGRNHYISNLLEPGIGGQCAMAPRSAADVQQDYFDRYGVYQQPLHFNVPADELLSDRTLERLVFEAVGAHRLELVHDDGRPEGLNPMVPALPAPPDVKHLLEVLPDKIRGHARFVVRMEGLFEDLPVRKAMARWGGNAFFSESGTLLALQYNGDTLVAGESDKRSWDYLKFVFRSSLVSTVTAFDHLVSTHIIVSETLALAATEMLPPDHPLRLFLFPHLYKSLNINFKAANNLFPRNMVVHRASPYDDDAFQSEDGSTGLLWRKASSLFYRTFPEMYATYRKFSDEFAEMPEVAFFEDGMLLHEILGQHVRRFLDQYAAREAEACDQALKEDLLLDKFVSRFFELNDGATPDFWPHHFRQAKVDCKALEQLLTECLFLVTGWHRHVGTVADFFRDTRFAGTSWGQGELEPRPKHAMLMMLLAASTNANVPKLGGQIEKIFKDWRGTRGMPNFERLSTDLKEAQEEISWRNEARSQAGLLQFHQMEPRFVEWSVAT